MIHISCLEVQILLDRVTIANSSSMPRAKLLEPANSLRMRQVLLLLQS